jgi:hypothetical protein
VPSSNPSWVGAASPPSAGCSPPGLPNERRRRPRQPGPTHHRASRPGLRGRRTTELSVPTIVDQSDILREVGTVCLRILVRAGLTAACTHPGGERSNRQGHRSPAVPSRRRIAPLNAGESLDTIASLVD